MVERFPRERAHDEVFGALERDGVAIVEEGIDTERIDALYADLRPQLDAVPWCNVGAKDDPEFSGRLTKRLRGMVARSPRVGPLLVEPLLLGVCDRFLGPNARDYRLSTGELIAIGAGQVAQPLHRDADSWRHCRPPFPILMSAIVALTDFTPRNGATVVVPGSHRWPRLRRPEAAELERASMPRGSVLLYHGQLLHGGGASDDGELRIGLYLGYIPSWLRPIENQCITSGLDALRAVPPRVQALLDYSDDGWETLA
ncbi:phytanoyl-CoA dioxygenase family protein [Paraliomyxa miuraensis]|nr:phytanoyl-CoA dioxygenase family protein [Paraliomyxa miuraensis]